MVQKLLRLLALFALWATTAAAAPMERGAAITDPEILRSLDNSGLSLGRLLGAEANT